MKKLGTLVIMLITLMFTTSVLASSSTHRLSGQSSYYADFHHGKLTANGEIFNMHGLTAAHRTLPLGSIIRVTNLSNEKSVVLRVNDRGPYAKRRVLDVSYGAAIKLGMLQSGVANVKIDVLHLPSKKQKYKRQKRYV